ncbi:hypothetical protein SCLARK_001008 [Spiroplasma clarkii]|nr:hypothetical protein SCLARK_001008 [Spiroplasma clarkii]
MAVTVMKGWKTVGKLLLTVSSTGPFDSWQINLFLNAWMRSLANLKITPNLDEDNFEIETNSSIPNLIEAFTNRNNQIKGLNLTSENFKINEDETGFSFNGYEYLLKNK